MPIFVLALILAVVWLYTQVQELQRTVKILARHIEDLETQGRPATPSPAITV